MCFPLKWPKKCLLLFKHFIILCKRFFTFITKFKSNIYLSNLSEYWMWPHWLIHDMNKPALSLIFTCKLNFCLIWFFLSQSRIFHAYVDVIIAGEGLPILTYARQSWPLLSVLHLLWHGASVYNGHLRDTHACWWALSSGSVINMFLRLSSVAAGIRKPSLPHARRTL